MLDKEPRIVAGRAVYDCMVSWYGEDDTVFFQEGGRDNTYEHVVAGINPEQMERDEVYLQAVIKGLLAQKRVRRYLETGLKTEQEIEAEIERTGAKGTWPCGRYIGEITKRDNQYIKSFDAMVGRMEHNSPQMMAEREKHRMNEERKRAQRIADKQAQIARLQSEIDQETK